MTAFLQMTDAKGVVYGNVCANCRKIAGEKIAPVEPDDHSTSTSGKKIDNRAKVAGDIDRKQQFYDTEAAYHAERDRKEKDATVQEDKKIIQVGEKRKRDLFSDRPQSPTERKKAAQTIFSTKSEIEKKRINTAQNIERKEKEKLIAQEEADKGGFRFDRPVEEGRFGVLEKHKGIGYDSLMRIAGKFGKNSRIGGTAENLAQKDVKPETPEDFVKDNWTSPKPRFRK